MRSCSHTTTTARSSAWRIRRSTTYAKVTLELRDALLGLIDARQPNRGVAAASNAGLNGPADDASAVTLVDRYDY
jgi:hypothetical protein